MREIECYSDEEDESTDNNGSIIEMISVRPNKLTSQTKSYNEQKRRMARHKTRPIFSAPNA